MITTKDGHEIHEPQVLALLLELEADTIYDPELFTPNKGDQVFDDDELAAVRCILLDRHGHRLTPAQKQLIGRAGQIELEHAGWILQAHTFGLHLSVWPDLTSDEQYKVTFRMSHWSARTGSKTTVFDDFPSCVEWVRKQKNEGGTFDYLHVQVRPVGQWQGFTGTVEYALDPDVDHGA
jgi:hypothetical protein